MEPGVSNSPALPPVTPQPPAEARPAKPVLRWILAVLIIVVLVAGGVYWWQNGKVNNLDSQISVLNTKLSSAQKPAPASQTTEGAAVKTESVTKTLPNGETISYPLTPTNATIIWWWGNSSYGENSEGNTLGVTSTKYIQFVSGLDPAVLKKACGIDPYAPLTLDSTNLGPSTAFYTVNMNDAAMGNVFKAGQLTLHGQSASCMDTIADPSYGGKYAAAAKNLISEVTGDFQAWAKSVTIK